MELVAAQLAAFIAKHVTLPPANAVDHELEKRRITNYGDIVVMLDLPAGQRSVPERDRATITRVVAADGNDWRPDRARRRHRARRQLLQYLLAGVDGMG